VVKARALFGSASFGPDEIKTLTRAFDEAWVLVAPSVSARPDSIEAARTKLATIVLELAQNGARPPNAEQMRDEAIHLMLAHITKSRPRN
jgi:hypothetical protein